MRSVLLFLFAALFLHNSIQARTWRLNNQSGISADFTTLSAAFSSSNVMAGDTLYVEGSAINYNFATLTKRLVVIGPGYYLSEAGSNPGLQFNGQSAKVSIAIDSLASGTELYGLQGSVFLNSNADNVKIIRCQVNFNQNNTFPNSKASDIEFRQCFINISFTPTMENVRITNCIIQNLLLSSVINGLIRNNTFPGPCSVINSYVSNNIFLSSVTLTNCSVKNNVSTGNNLPAGNNNKLGIPIANLIVNTGSNDGKYVLTDNSPAKTAGETINGETPDAGAFGTGDPYRLSGIPPIPTIYALQAPSSVPATATVMTVTISTRSNN